MMRLNRLDLTRYGRFTDRVLDFGAPRPGQPDLHIVHGPNEAGKSTLLNAWLDLLFGIGARSPYGFLHSYDAMQIGAELDLPGGPQTLIRTKGRRDTLTDGTGRALADTALSAALGGLDRGALADMFALDSETMERGGESILSSQGDLGELLFSATAGLSELGRKLDGLRSESDRFWKKSARNTRLKDLRAELDALDGALREIDVQAPEHARRRAAAEAARSDHDRLAAAAATAAAARDRARTLRDALPLLGEWRGLDAELAPLLALPEAPADWAARVEALIRDDIALTAAARATADQIERLRVALDGMAPDDTALALADAAGFDETLRADFLSARGDLPRRRDRLAALDRRLAELAAAIGTGAGATGPGAALDGGALDGAALDALEALAADHAALAERRRGAADEARQAEAALTDAGGAIDEADDDDPAVAALRAALDPLRAADLPARVETTGAEAAEAETRRDAALARLAPWRGDAAALRRLAVPGPDTLARWRARLDAARRACDDAARIAADRRAEADRHAADHDGLAATLGEAAPEAAAEARDTRDAAWAAHRAALTGDSADRFAAAMAAHDRATGAQLARAADLGRLHGLRHAAATADRLSARAARAAEQAAQALAAARADLAQAAGFLPGRDPEDPLAGLDAWLADRDRALDLADAAEAAARAAGRARADAARAAAALAAALGQGAQPAADPDGLRGLAAAARAALNRAEAEAARRAERLRLTRALAQRRRAVVEADHALTAWTEALHRALAPTGLAADPPAPERLRGLLPLLRERAEALREADGLRHRIVTMQADQQRFADAVAELAARLNLPAGDTMETHAAAAARLDRARRIADLRAATARQIETAEAEARSHAETRARLTAEATGIIRHLSVPDLAGARLMLEAIARRAGLREQAGRRAAQICAMLGVATMPEARAALDGATPDALAEALARAETGCADAEARLEPARQALYRAEAELAAVPGDDRVAGLRARRQALMLTIEDEARAWLRQRAGVLATTRALDAYRASHRGTMLARASDAFAAMTGGGYAGLAAQPDGNGGERLIARTAGGGGSKLPAELSKGTRFQLYLALRIAGFHEWAAAHGPVPVLADDIMESFDETRTRLALIELAEASRAGQIIYLTHHSHVRDLARATCPGARILEL